MSNLWHEHHFKETFFVVIGFLALLGVFIFPKRKKNTFMHAAWASVQSWLFFLPILFLTLAAGGFWPLAGVAILSLLSAKEFFQITGMYHRSIFIWLTYISILFMAYFISIDNYTFYDITPMVFLGVICLIPILLNRAQNMLQYVSLSLLASLFMGWGFLHLGWILMLKEGAFLVIYIILLSEVGDNISLTISRFYGKRKLADNITPRRTVEGFLVSIVATLFMAWAFRNLLPKTDELYWISFGLTAALVGNVGDLTLSMIRRDLGVKDVGIFIIGRGGFLDRIDRLIFIAPIYYFLILYFGFDKL